MESRGNIATIASPTKSAQHVVRDRPYALGWVNAPERAGRITATPNGGANRPTAHLSSTIFIPSGSRTGAARTRVRRRGDKSWRASF